MLLIVSAVTKWSPIKVLSKLIDAYFQWSSGNQYFQHDLTINSIIHNWVNATNAIKFYLNKIIKMFHMGTTII